MSKEQLFASFLLDRGSGQGIALDALDVVEAIKVRPIQPVPDSSTFLEGFMRLRNHVLPVINLKKRFGFAKTDYDDDASVAVVSLSGYRMGLLFDDILEVLRITEDQIIPIPKVLLSDDWLVSGLIPRQGNNLEVMELKQLFKGRDPLEGMNNTQADNNAKPRARVYRKFIIFSSDGQKYGVPVNHAKELTYCTGMDKTFASGCIEGALRLRGRTMPVVNSRVLLNKTPCKGEPKESCRILVMEADGLYFGMIMDEVHQIMTMDTADILPMPFEARQSVTGLYETDEHSNIMLLDMDHLIAEHAATLQSISRMKNADDQARDKKSVHHLITENGYLVFTIEHVHAVQIKDVQEIIPRNAVMNIPASQSDDSEVINLRGLVVPVVNLRKFYGYPDRGKPGEQLIICRTESATVALEVDNIKTIFKQEQCFETPSLRPQLQPRKDTLDRLIDLSEGQGRQQHVLVVNVRNMVANHLLCGQCPPVDNKESADADDMITQ